MSKPLPSKVDGVLFDLDGTLVDSAPDLYAALRLQCDEEGMAAPDYSAMRQAVSSGTRAILRSAFAARGEAAIQALVPRYLDIYQTLLTRQTLPFEGIEALLQQIEADGLCWGIVTNKAAYLAVELVTHLGWTKRSRTLVGGDTLPVKKPDPAPVLLACGQAGLKPAHGVFVGDDPRDVRAGSAAGLYTVAVGWGYLNGGDPKQWGADAVVDTPQQLAELLRRRKVPA